MVWPEGTNKERRQRTPADVALVLREAFSPETDPAEMGSPRVPRRIERFRRGLRTGRDEPYSDPRLKPSGLPEPAGRFHRGATRGELDSIIISGRVELDASR